MAVLAHHIDVEKLERNRSEDQTNPARGIMIGCGIAACLWAPIVVGVWMATK